MKDSLCPSVPPFSLSFLSAFMTPEEDMEPPKDQQRLSHLPQESAEYFGSLYVVARIVARLPQIKDLGCLFVCFLVVVADLGTGLIP